MRKGECRQCGAEDLEVVYVVEGGARYHRQRAWTPERFHICGTCYDRGPTPVTEWGKGRVRWYQIPGRGEQMPPTPCEHCGVTFVRNADPLLRRMTCSATCLTSLTRSRNGNRGSGQACETCGEQITTGRADSRYCSSACRQKAYRRRVSNT